MPTMKELNQKPAGQVERPLPLPVGTYLLIVKNYIYGKSAKKQTDQITFNLSPQSPEADVDPDLFQQYIDRYGQVNHKDYPTTFYLTDDALWRLVEWHKNFDYFDANLTLEQMAPMCPGNPIRGHVSHQVTQSGGIYANFDQFIKA